MEATLFYANQPLAKNQRQLRSRSIWYSTAVGQLIENSSKAYGISLCGLPRLEYLGQEFLVYVGPSKRIHHFDVRYIHGIYMVYTLILSQERGSPTGGFC